MDSEVERDGAVAVPLVASGKEVRQGVAGRGEVSVVVPVEAVAHDGGGVARGAVVDGEVEGEGTVAVPLVASGEEVRQCVVGGGEVGVVVPVEAVAHDGGGVANGAVVDGKIQGDGAVATYRVGKEVRQCVGGGGEVGVVVPVKAVAHDGGSVAIGAVVDGEVEGDGAVAALGRKQIVRRGGRGGEGGVVPGELVASDGGGVARQRCVTLEDGGEGAVALHRDIDGVGGEPVAPSGEVVAGGGGGRQSGGGAVVEGAAAADTAARGGRGQSRHRMLDGCGMEEDVRPQDGGVTHHLHTEAIESFGQSDPQRVDEAHCRVRQARDQQRVGDAISAIEFILHLEISFPGSRQQFFLVYLLTIGSRSSTGDEPLPHRPCYIEMLPAVAIVPPASTVGRIFGRIITTSRGIVAGCCVDLPDDPNGVVARHLHGSGQIPV